MNKEMLIKTWGVLKKGRKVAVVTLLISVFIAYGLYAASDRCIDDSYTECSGYRTVNYLVNDIEKLDEPYNYIIGQTKYWILEIIGVLAVLGAIGFAFLHGFGRYIANRKKPIRLEKEKEVFIYKLIIRLGHWLNAISVLALLITGFVMHYAGPSNLLAWIHSIAGGVFVLLWILFILYEILTFDIKQYIVRGWELREGILRQALFYTIGIFKQEEHPYHMKPDARLNPLQKIAYFSIMFFLVPLLGITGLLLVIPERMGFAIQYFGMENMKFVFIIHLAGAFTMLAYLLGHLYLGTTGDKVSQHYKVMITGKHDEFERQPVKPS